MAAMAHPAETLIVADMATSLTGWEGNGNFDPNNPNNPGNKHRIRRAAYANGQSKDFFWTDAAWQGPFNPIWDDDARHGRKQVIGYADGHTKVRQASQTTVDLYGY
jgi:hypothetical protein